MPVSYLTGSNRQVARRLFRTVAHNCHAQAFGVSQGSLDSIAGEENFALELQCQGNVEHVKATAVQVSLRDTLPFLKFVP
jgi:hypothetical protein